MVNENLWWHRWQILFGKDVDDPDDDDDDVDDLDDDDNDNETQLVQTADSCQESGECAKMCRSSRLSGGANSKFLNLWLSLLDFWDDCSFNILKDIFVHHNLPTSQPETLNPFPYFSTIAFVISCRMCFS